MVIFIGGFYKGSYFLRIVIDFFRVGIVEILIEKTGVR